jgi:hypothetical protein
MTRAEWDAWADPGRMLRAALGAGFIGRLAQHLWGHREELFTFLRQPGPDATNGRAELAVRGRIMDEATGAAGREPSEMLNFLRTSGRGSDGKLRLVCCAVCRAVAHLLTDDPSAGRDGSLRGACGWAIHICQ